MVKSVITYIFIFALLFFLGYYLHHYLLGGMQLSFSLKKVYAFHAIASFLICASLLFLSFSKKMQPQLGFIYLALLTLKFILFIAFFYNSIIKHPLPRTQTVNLLLPLLVFLIAEVAILIKIVNKKLN